MVWYWLVGRIRRVLLFIGGASRDTNTVSCWGGEGTLWASDMGWWLRVGEGIGGGQRRPGGDRRQWFEWQRRNP